MVLDELLAFCRVVEEESFTKASQLLHLSQPAVTKQVARLEEELGIRLLDRRGRKISPTPAGRLVYAYAKRITTTAGDLLTAVQDMNSPGHGDVWVGCVTTIGVYTLPPLLAAYTQSWPDVRVHVKTGQIQETMERVLHNDVDVGFVTVPVSHPDLVTTPLFRDPVVLVASPTFARGLPLPMNVKDLAQVPLVAYQASSRFRTFTDAALEQRGVIPQVVMEFDSHEAVVTMVSLGFGAALVPKSSVEASLRAGTLNRIDVEDLGDLARTTALILRKDTHKTPAIKAFLAQTLDLLFHPAAAQNVPEGTASLFFLDTP